MPYSRGRGHLYTVYLVTKLGLAHALHHGHKLSSAAGELHLNQIQTCKQCLTHFLKKTDKRLPEATTSEQRSCEMDNISGFSLVIENIKKKLL